MLNNMPNYTLTTDLIADCMALIPQYLELLNKQQEKFGVKPPRPNRGHHREYQNTILFDFHGDVVADVGYECDHEFYFGQSAIVDFILISHCLRNIPEFQAENPKLDYVKECYEYNKALAENPQSQNRFILWHATGCYREEIDSTPKTIASATLHGQGEFPPSTLVELRESYKNVMSKWYA
jgi:hypothetical protein